MRALAWGLAALGLAIGLGAILVSTRPPATPPPAAEDPTLPVLSKVDRFELTDADGRPFGTDDLAGRPWVVDFIFTHCAGQCVEMSRAMRQVQDEVADLALVSITVDPARDTPERLAWYAERQGADRLRWHFLTGDRSTIAALSVESFRLGVSASADELDLVHHSSRFVLVDAEGRIRGYYDGVEPAAVDRLIADLALLAPR